MRLVALNPARASGLEAATGDRAFREALAVQGYNRGVGAPEETSAITSRNHLCPGSA